MRHEEAEPRAELPQLFSRLVDRLDAVVQVERLPLTRNLPLERLLDQVVVELADVGANRATALRRRLDDGDVAQPRERHVQCARDRRRGERQHVHLEAQRAQQLLLGHAEALLLVDDHEPELLRDHVARQHPVRPDQHVDLAVGELGQHALHVGRPAEARDHLDPDREVAVALPERVPVLLGEHGRRHEHEDLLAGDSDGECRAERDLGLAEADVAADETVHGAWRLEILLDGLDRRALILGLAIRKLGFELLDPLVLDVVRDARLRLPLCVELQQVARELSKVLARPRLQVVPRLASELRQRRCARVGADVAADLPDLLVGDVDAVVAAEGEQEIVARDARDLLRLEAEQLGDAVVLVHDVVAGAEVREALQRTARSSRGARRSLAEDLRVGQQRDAEVAPDEAPACR